MIGLTSAQETLTNIVRLIQASGVPLPSSQQELGNAYGKCISINQPNCVWLRPNGQSLRNSLQDTIADSEAKVFYEIFCGDSAELDDLGQAYAINARSERMREQVSELGAAFDFLEARSGNHAYFLNLAVQRVFVDGSDVAAGGTTSDAVGLVWANPHPRFSAADLAEFLVHELTHTLMFLDEWLFQHYTQRLTHDETTWCYSAILKKERPIDKVLHSIIVASEIVLLRQEYLSEPEAPKAHPPTTKLKSALRESVNGIRMVSQRTGILTTRALALLDRVEDRVL